MFDNPAIQVDEVIDRLQAAFERDPWINLHSYPVEFRSEDGRLVMDGTVEHVAAKRRARVLAESLVGQHLSVDDRLRREPVEKQGDRQIRDKVMDWLSMESMFLEYTLGAETGNRVETIRDSGPGSHEIIVHVDDGKVTLKGSVGSLTHRRVAEAMTWWVYGCETVENQLAVMPDEEDSDDEINDAVRIVLEKDPTLDADQFHTRTSDHVVQIEGLAADDMMKKYAVMDVWSVSGVWDVVDRVSVKGSEPA
ncbi:BON domain-containing protein [Marinobacter sp.]|uniref:BON domain-containing protein n=1 Tax=Marinobacter sp. TaxID=50741 RepID=UPI0038502AE2